MATSSDIIAQLEINHKRDNEKLTENYFKSTGKQLPTEDLVEWITQEGACTFVSGELFSVFRDRKFDANCYEDFFESQEYNWTLEQCIDFINNNLNQVERDYLLHCITVEK